MLLMNSAMMNELLQKSLNIGEDGRCKQHPDVTVLEQGASCLGNCHLCAMEAAQKKDSQLEDTTSTTLSSSFLWTSDNSGMRRSSSSESKEQQPPPPPSERQQQQALLESILARWGQVQEDSGGAANLQQSIALATPLILKELRKLAAQVEDQQKTIQSQQDTILKLQQSVEEKHKTTQDVLQTILQQVTAKNGADTAAMTVAAMTAVVAATVAATPPPSTPPRGAVSSTASQPAQPEASAKPAAATTAAAAKEESSNTTGGKLFRSPARTRLKRRTSRTHSMSSTQRSVDSGVKQPLTRHDSKSSLRLNELRLVTPVRTQSSSQKSATRQQPLKQQQDTTIPSASQQPMEFTPVLPASEMELLSASQNSHHNREERRGLAGRRTLSGSQEIALDGSHHSLERSDLPDMEAIFEEGFGDDMQSLKRIKFNLPRPEPMEIILESNQLPSGAAAAAPATATDNNNSNSNHNMSSGRKLLPSSPEEVGLEFDATQEPKNKNIMAAVGHSSMLVFPTQEKEEVGMTGHMSLQMLTLNAAAEPDHDSDLSESAYEGNDSEGEDGEMEASYQLEDQEPNDYSIEDLQNVSRYKMIDMYGDQGTYTGTIGPDNDPTGFGTMKYDSGRFYKGEWKKGRWFGKGTLLNANGDSYQGDFVSDARHGKGVYRFTSGDVYEGDFYEDNRHGKGKFKFHNGSVYAGDFCMGSFEGFGRYDFEGGYYEGDWKRDEYYGKGKLQYKDGSNYEGRFKRGSAHGFGEERLADGTIRRGLWRRGEFLQECTEDECKRLESKSAHSSGAKNKAKAGIIGKSAAA